MARERVRSPRTPALASEVRIVMPTELEQLNTQLRSPLVWERRTAAKSLGNSGSAAIPCLLQALQDNDGEVRVAAAQELASIGPAAVGCLAVRLRSRHASDRQAAAWALGFCGSGALQPLESALGQVDDDVRLAAVAALRRLALPESVPHLCRMLPDPVTRTAAVEALGDIGDHRAVGPLTEALRRQLIARSGRRQVAIGWLVLLIGLLAIPGVLLGQMWFGWKSTAVILAMGGVTMTIQYVALRRHLSLSNHQIVDVLLRIGERSATSDLRRVLPDLRAIAGDRLQSDPRARAASRAAAERIEALTAEWTNLPLPGNTSADSASLPRAGQPPLPEEASLPRVP